MPEPLTPDSPSSPRRHPELPSRAVEDALSSPPVIAISADFAHRLAALAAAETASRHAAALPANRFARAALLVCVAAVFLALLAVFPALLRQSSAGAITFTSLLSIEAVLLAAVFGPWQEPWLSAA